MNKWAFALLLVLSACKHGESSNSPVDDSINEPPDLPSYEFNFDMETPNGIKIQSNGLFAPDLAEVDVWYEETLQCVEDAYSIIGITGFIAYDGPPVVIVEDLEALCATQPGYNGVYCTNYAQEFMGLDWVRGASHENIWKHEFIHHILYMNDFNRQSNLNHQPPEVWACQG